MRFLTRLVSVLVSAARRCFSPVLAEERGERRRRNRFLGRVSVRFWSGGKGEGVGEVGMLEEHVSEDIARHPVDQEKPEGFHDRELHAGSVDVSKVPFVHRPDLEVVAVAFGVAPEFPFPSVIGGHGILDGFAVLGDRIVLWHDQVVGPVGAGEDVLFPVGRWFRPR